MSLKRLYDLDKSFSDQLDKLLHDEEYVNGLRELPERELVQIVNHLDNVGFTSVREAYLIAFIDHSPPQRWRGIQEVPPRVTRYMPHPENSPHNLRVV